MGLTPGTRLGPYEIQSPLGAGGMGEVYRARDTKLGREVAIKVLPEAFAQDADRLARFEREAKTLASLNDPNIAIIHGLEQSGDVHALVMELVEGEDLSQRIARGAISIDEALPIARQIAEALEAAHEQGIIHRDLKPANIKVRPDGTVKVLDFGLAKAMEPASALRGPGGHALSQAPTITTPAMTQAGMILGTAAYMSPEQASGKPVDRRGDLWAFGVVLYEMLTGRRLFDGETVSHVLAAVLTKEPDWTTLPTKTPASIRKLLRRCLEKDRKRRIDSAAAARLEIEEALGGAGSADETPAQSRIDEAVAAARAHDRRGVRRRMALAAVAALLAVGVAIGATWRATRPAPPRVVQTTIATTGATALTISAGDRDLAITPDGGRVVYAGNGGRTLFVRALDTLEPTPLYTGSPRAPFVSPDGQWVGFVEANLALKKVAITGGPAVTLVDEDGTSRGAACLPDDTVVFATGSPATGLQQVSASGGAVTVLTHPDPAQGEADHLWPEALPGGRAVLFTIAPTTGSANEGQIAVFDLNTRTSTVVLRGGSHAHYVPGPPARPDQAGYLVYATGATLRAVAFDPTTRTTQGTSVQVASDVVTTSVSPSGGVDAVVAADGTLAFVRAVGGAETRRQLVWVDRQGRETPIALPTHVYQEPSLSPDGTHVAVGAADSDSDIWVSDIARGSLTRLTFSPRADLRPVWAPDGGRLFFSSERDGTRNLYTQAADGTGTAERLATSPNQQNATGVTPDGTHLVFYETSPKTGADVLQVEVAGTHTVTPLVQTPATERNGVVSPDGRWLAYEADDAGDLEIYVRPYPDVGSGRWQISTGGGVRPTWSNDGRELFYASPIGALMRVGVERGGSWAATTPTMLLRDGSVFMPSGNPGPTYDISPDGQRFVVLKEASGPGAVPPQIVVIQHFDELLKRLVPTN